MVLSATDFIHIVHIANLVPVTVLIPCLTSQAQYTRSASYRQVGQTTDRFYHDALKLKLVVPCRD